MGMRSGTSFQKRQKEIARMEKQRDKAARRMQRKADKAAGIVRPDSDDDLMAEGGETETETDAAEQPSDAQAHE